MVASDYFYVISLGVISLAGIGLSVAIIYEANQIRNTNQASGTLITQASYIYYFGWALLILSIIGLIISIIWAYRLSYSPRFVYDKKLRQPTNRPTIADVDAYTISPATVMPSQTTVMPSQTTLPQQTGFVTQTVPTTRGNLRFTSASSAANLVDTGVGPGFASFDY